MTDDTQRLKDELEKYKKALQYASMDAANIGSMIFLDGDMKWNDSCAWRAKWKKEAGIEYDPFCP